MLNKRLIADERIIERIAPYKVVRWGHEAWSPTILRDLQRKYESVHESFGKEGASDRREEIRVGGVADS
jgi:hypothetical protein